MAIMATDVFSFVHPARIPRKKKTTAAKIPEKYWHPDTMNWLLLQSYKNRNYTTEYLLTLYDQYIKNGISLKDKIKLQKISSSYQHSLKKLMKY